MSSEEALSVGELAGALAAAFPLQDAEPWDNVGLIVGAPDARVRGVLTTLDATAEAVHRACSSGANVLVTHHPPFIGPMHPPVEGSGPSGTVAAALAEGVAVISMHTNLDRSAEGASVLPSLLGLSDLVPLESGTQEIVVVTTYVPPGSAAAVRAAMAGAGAGSIGGYEDCAFAAEGTGYYRPGPGSRPAVDGGADGVPEVRIEMVASRSDVAAVLDAAVSAHPYEEPLIVATDAVRARGRARLGRVGRLQRARSLGQLAGLVASALGVTVRVWGESDRPVSRVAVANGSAGSLITAAVAAADVLVAGEVRYHDALDAVARGLAIVEAGHDATEWPLVDVLADAVARSVGGAPVFRETACPGWWTTEASDDAR